MKMLKSIGIGLFATCFLCYGVRGAPPTDDFRIPEYLDFPTVCQYIDTVDQPRHALILKAGYFGRAGKQDPPVAVGLQRLQDMLHRERVGSKRWFYGENLLGFACFQSEDARDKAGTEGFAAYKALFDHSDLAESSGAVGALRGAIWEFVSIFATKITRLNLSDSVDGRGFLRSAWSAYVFCLSHSLASEAAVPPSFDRKRQTRPT